MKGAEWRQWVFDKPNRIVVRAYRPALKQQQVVQYRYIGEHQLALFFIHNSVAIFGEVTYEHEGTYTTFAGTACPIAKHKKSLLKAFAEHDTGVLQKNCAKKIPLARFAFTASRKQAQDYSLNKHWWQKITGSINDQKLTL